MAGSKGKWVRRSAGEWRSLLSGFEASGLGVDAFCRRQGVSTASFYRWRRLLSVGAAGGEPAAVAPGFFDLGVLGPAGASGARLELKLDLGGGVTVHLVRA